MRGTKTSKKQMINYILIRPTNISVTRIVRPMPEHLMVSFGLQFGSHNWSDLNGKTSSEMVANFQNQNERMIEESFPTKSIKISNSQKQRIYQKEGKTEKYKSIHRLVSQILKTSVQNYERKLVKDLEEEKYKNIYSAIQRLDYCKSETPKEVVLSSHQETNLSPIGSAERIVAHFAAISQKLEPLNVDSLPPNLKESLANTDKQGPVIEEYKVYKKINKDKKKLSCSK